MRVKIGILISFVLVSIFVIPQIFSQEYNISLDSYCCGRNINLNPDECKNVSSDGFDGYFGVEYHCKFTISKLDTSLRYDSCYVKYSNQYDEVDFAYLGNHGNQDNKIWIDDFNNGKKISIDVRMPQFDRGEYNGYFFLKCGDDVSNSMNGVINIKPRQNGIDWNEIFASTFPYFIGSLITGFFALLSALVAIRYSDSKNIDKVLNEVKRLNKLIKSTLKKG